MDWTKPIHQEENTSNPFSISAERVGTYPWICHILNMKIQLLFLSFSD